MGQRKQQGTPTRRKKDRTIESSEPEAKKERKPRTKKIGENTSPTKTVTFQEGQMELPLSKCCLNRYAQYME